MSGRHIEWIGAGVGSGSHDERTRGGPEFLEELRPGLFSSIVKEQPLELGLKSFSNLAQFNKDLAHKSFLTKLKGNFPLVIGGDHSCAIGTWSGISSFLGAPLGMLWIDAHMDSHTFQTSHTGNIHGMPLASLLGHGEMEFTDLMASWPKLDPTRTVLFGVRSFEREEEQFLKSLDVRVFHMSEIIERGFRVCWKEAEDIVTNGDKPFGVSLDLDGLDPMCVPGVGTPVSSGLDPQRVHWALSKLCSHPMLAGFEIVEFNPYFDIGNVTADFIFSIANSLENSSSDQPAIGLNSHSFEAPGSHY